VEAKEALGYSSDSISFVFLTSVSLLNPLKNQNCQHIANATEEHSTHEMGAKQNDG
jgi:hypothetical protein